MVACRMRTSTSSHRNMRNKRLFDGVSHQLRCGIQLPLRDRISGSLQNHRCKRRRKPNLTFGRHRKISALPGLRRNPPQDRRVDMRSKQFHHIIAQRITPIRVSVQETASRIKPSHR
jgi:hypothetical protein